MIDPVHLAQALIRRPSVTPDDEGALGLLAGALEPLGFAITALPFAGDGGPRTENLYARIGSEGPVFCFAGHTDVVPPGDLTFWKHDPFDAVIENGILYGRGAVDMKSSIACFAAAVERHLAKGPLKGSIVFLITGDEEGDAINGTPKMLRWLKDKAITFDHCLIGEPSSQVTVGDGLKVGRRGSLNTRVTVEGVQGHVAWPGKAKNPVHALAEFVTRLTATPLDSGTALFDPSTLVFTSVDTGNPTCNLIPAKATGAFNIRFSDAHSFESLKTHLNTAAKAVSDATGCTVSLDFNLSGVADAVGPGPFMDLLDRAVARVTGTTPAHSTGGGTSDGRFIKDLCPVVELGLVNATMHQSDECVPLADIARLTDIYTAILNDYFE
ncbi:succinyl-diaminopimelate desuccinylase [Rhizomicrobium electricum]|uniref:Succinyl-diaminopimelate desuccinylase n=1 Tax=Rhizomicrobium electricum TaxID=480070 RepID=A0ABP3Q9S4_9PROT|nr:succinyl-diaminopimelate desuccinylase [Rhizomicrobium electricum]NIJ49458.1 succinyl-diaminopimelate desuccinylase [Rhizomicrobium electricum]